MNGRQGNAETAAEVAERSPYGEASQAYALLAVAEAINGLAKAVASAGRQPLPVKVAIGGPE